VHGRRAVPVSRQRQRGQHDQSLVESNHQVRISSNIGCAVLAVVVVVVVAVVVVVVVGGRGVCGVGRRCRWCRLENIWCIVAPKKCLRTSSSKQNTTYLRDATHRKLCPIVFCLMGGKGESSSELKHRVVLRSPRRFASAFPKPSMYACRAFFPEDYCGKEPRNY